MSGWIKFDKDMIDDPRLLEAASTASSGLSMSVVSAESEHFQAGNDLPSVTVASRVTLALRGAIVTLWCYADTHIRHDDTLPIKVNSLERMLGWDGICDLLPDEWVEVLPDGTVKLPGYCEKNALIAKRKAAEKAAERSRRYRKRQASEPSRPRHASRGRDGSVTSRVTRVVDQDLDQDLDHKRGDRQGSGGEKGVTKVGGAGPHVDNPSSPAPPQEQKSNGHDPRAFEVVKAHVLELVQKFKTHDAAKLFKLGGRSMRLTQKQISAAIKQLREDREI